IDDLADTQHIGLHSRGFFMKAYSTILVLYQQCFSKGFRGWHARHFRIDTSPSSHPAPPPDGPTAPVTMGSPFRSPPCLTVKQVALIPKRCLRTPKKWLQCRTKCYCSGAVPCAIGLRKQEIYLSRYSSIPFRRCTRIWCRRS